MGRPYMLRRQRRAAAAIGDDSGSRFTEAIAGVWSRLA